MLILQQICYNHPDKDVLFNNLDLVINHREKIALTGNNGAGKSTLLKILAGILQPSSGIVKAGSKPYYVPQHFGQFNDYTVGEVLNINDKLHALKEILDGQIGDASLAILDDDWAIEERAQEALAHWKLSGIGLTQQMNTLSGGEKTKVFLAGIDIHKPQIILMDEPSNHLDTIGRDILYHYIETSLNTLLVVSHDRKLLNLVDTVCELNKKGLTLYGGNYDFYTEQKEIEKNALDENLKDKEKALRKAREVQREALERKQRLDARGRAKQDKARLPTISMKTFKNSAEKSTSRLKGAQTEKIEGILSDVNRLRKELPGNNKMKVDFDNSKLHKGKKLITAKEINVVYNNRAVWQRPLSFEIVSGKRIAIKGPNGAGKTTLIKAMLGEVEPAIGTIERASVNAVYFDQDYSLVKDKLTVYQQAREFNYRALAEHEIKISLARFLFTKTYWDKPCWTLSGGEKMRLMLCCLAISNETADIIILDEPTNNLDIENVDILIAAVNEYEGTLIVVSHDAHFLKQANIQEEIDLAY